MALRFEFRISDNGGKRHSYTITARDKQDAIEKGFKRAKKNAKGDLNLNWECKFLGDF